MKDSDVIGKKFHRLTVLCRNGNSKNHSKQYLCRCDCGTEKTIIGIYLLDGRVKSCGCFNREATGNRHRTHNMTHTRLFSIWQNMNTRCSNEKCSEYHNYGGRGITVCEDWKNDFLSFYKWAVANGYDDSLSIDRIDNNRNYEPSNCRWATKKLQANNTRVNHLFTYEGETRTIAEWSELKNINYKKLWSRIKRNWPEEKIFE